MINHRYKKTWLKDSLEGGGYIVKNASPGKIVVRSEDDNKHVCDINYETMRVEFEQNLGDDVELTVMSILEICEKKMIKEGLISENVEEFTVV